jgi:hypothetical protein
MALSQPMWVQILTQDHSCNDLTGGLIGCPNQFKPGWSL